MLFSLENRFLDCFEIASSIELIPGYMIGSYLYIVVFYPPLYQIFRFKHFQLNAFLGETTTKYHLVDPPYL